jgi:hypothetical protein
MGMLTDSENGLPHRKNNLEGSVAGKQNEQEELSDKPQAVSSRLWAHHPTFILISNRNPALFSDSSSGYFFQCGFLIEFLQVMV